MNITWKHNLSDISWPPPTFEKKVEYFYERALGWQLHIADLLANGGQPFGVETSIPRVPHSGFAVLHICLSYFETIGHYEQTDPAMNTSTDYFKAGVRSVLPDVVKDHEKIVDDLLSALYKGARCGLYHNSMTVPGVGLGQPPGGDAIIYEADQKILVISPERLPKVLKQHLERFRAALLDPENATLRENFEKRFNIDNGIA